MSPEVPLISPLSLRDPAGRLLLYNGRVFRLIRKFWVPQVRAFLNSKTAREFTESGRFVRTRILDPAAVKQLAENPLFLDVLSGGDFDLVAEHDPIPFPSFPYEWPPAMLHAAGTLTMDLARSLVREGFGIKDATPFNILFRGSEPVFVDLLSIERRDANDPVWVAYAQFVRTFLLPLLANRRFGIPLDQIFLTRRDGLEPSELYRWCNPLERLSPLMLTLSSLPTWLQSRADSSNDLLHQPKRTRDPAEARFVLERLFQKLTRTLEKLNPPRPRTSRWLEYESLRISYSAEELSLKEAFVEDALKQFQPRKVLDVGSNTGHFSILAARNGASVVAIDSDPAVLDELWRRARTERLDILPLMIHLSDPTPALGWRNQERPSFLERARGTFDAVLMLALIHHILVTDGIPLPEILTLLAALTTGICVVEFVGPEDPLFRRLVRGRGHLYEGLNSTAFEAACMPWFQIVRSCRLGKSERWLYLLRKNK